MEKGCTTRTHNSTYDGFATRATDRIVIGRWAGLNSLGYGLDVE
jgi:hypothetical protein